MAMTIRDLFIISIIALYIAKRRGWTGGRPSNVSLPPGPTGLPVVGAVLSIDASQPWFTYFQWRKLYGDIIYARLFNTTVLIINSAKVARELLEARSSIYSDRPNFATAEPYGIADGTVLMPYGDTWRLHRRIYHQTMNSEAATNYQPMQRAKAHQLIVNLADDPKRFFAHLHTYSTSIIMSIVYGYNTAPTNDPYVEYAERGMKAISKAIDPKRAALLRVFPFLLKLPAWMPGSFKAEAAEATHYATGFRQVLFDLALGQMASGASALSMVINAVRKNESNGNLPEVTRAIRCASSGAYGGGSETTSGILDVFILAMVLFPEAQRKAQKEIDAVVGSRRLPDFSDRPLLPFVEAVLRETLRWHPVGPLGIPHATNAEDMYEGFYIPKGTTVLINMWGLAHDEETYREPFKFKPERFIREDGTYIEGDTSFTFGFGRRICPGRYVANGSLWIAAASMLAAFEFLKERDEEGSEINFSPQFTSGLTSRPKPFPCRIVPRVSPGALKELVAQDD